MKFKISLLSILAALLSTACANMPGTTKNKLEACADSFAIHYFNYEFPQALPFCTPESEPWLRYASANVSQADIDLLRTRTEAATVEAEAADIPEGDTTAIVTVTVHNFLQMDSIGTGGNFVHKAVFRLPAVLREGSWLIKMAGLPRSERKSRG